MGRKALAHPSCSAASVRKHVLCSLRETSITDWSNRSHKFVEPSMSVTSNVAK